MTLRLVRRRVIAPLVLVGELVTLAASPVLAAVAAILSPLFGGRRPLRLLAFLLVYVSRHLAGLAACGGLWAAGRVRGRRLLGAHYRVLRWFVGGIARAALRAGRTRVEVHGPEAEAALRAGERPVIVLSMHSGEGDSLLVLDHLLSRYGRRPRVVMHETLRLDPLIAVLGRRLPNRFVDPRGGETETEIAAMSGGLGPRDAVLIFPEGGNFSARRRRESIERLERRGHFEEAASARAMRHVAAPRPGGALAAIAAAPQADVVFVAHQGFPQSLRETWRTLPDAKVVTVALWLVPAAAIPVDEQARIDWLFDWWRTLDEWVGKRPVGVATAR
ncbi:1-acyl-sn-glycerol-3-phosphate acyltransferase [Candidatus Solirubrobacter pratensis]|uniref:1-acyl-sn-glycerol-3-phosphate acyltransferase n=1 Tax=Candidatus Solirubrobacter pratensis TaxID=1298857 RepID=UPI00041A756D|nr:1-acyl-sn-glycerol-3-phosphate acyltransferase [Candidatus Solirubrobacter pratensis]